MSPFELAIGAHFPFQRIEVSIGWCRITVGSPKVDAVVNKPSVEKDVWGVFCSNIVFVKVQVYCCEDARTGRAHGCACFWRKYVLSNVKTLFSMTILIDSKIRCLGKVVGKRGLSLSIHCLVVRILCWVSMFLYIDTASLEPMRMSSVGRDIFWSWLMRSSESFTYEGVCFYNF